MVELMVVVMLVALVVLVSTQIPLFTFSFWRKGMERLEMQRDANYAMIKIQRKLRPASLTFMVEKYPDEGVVYDTLYTGEDIFRLNGDNLVQNGEIVIKGGTKFIVKRNGNAIKIELTLAREGVQTTLRTTVKPRN